MKIFVSWSGATSQKVALALRDWFPQVIQTVKPYVSSEDIGKGERWSSDIAVELQDSAFGVLCLTKENSESPWINFEAGALSKQVQKGKVSPFLFDMQPSDIKSNSPLLQFQVTLAKKEDVLKLMKSINATNPEAALDDIRLEEAVDMWWPKLERKLDDIRSAHPAQDDDVILRGENDVGVSKILEELLQLSRQQSLVLSNPINILPPEYLHELIAEGLGISKPLTGGLFGFGGWHNATPLANAIAAQNAAVSPTAPNPLMGGAGSAAVEPIKLPTAKKRGE